MTIKIVGARGYTAPCLAGALAAMERGGIVRMTLILSVGVTTAPVGLLFDHVNGGMTIVRDGFTYGYNGEGPRGLDAAMRGATYIVNGDVAVDLTDSVHLSRVSGDIARLLYAGGMNKFGIRSEITARSVSLAVEFGANTPGCYVDLHHAMSQNPRLALSTEHPIEHKRSRRPEVVAHDHVAAAEVADLTDDEIESVDGDRGMAPTLGSRS